MAFLHEGYAKKWHYDKTTPRNGETTPHNGKTTPRNGETPSFNDETTPRNGETTSHNDEITSQWWKPHHVITNDHIRKLWLSIGQC